MEAENSITIFSNGMADYVKAVPVPAGEPVTYSIPVRKRHIGDVLASLNISGDVTVAQPATYQPENADHGALTITPSRPLNSLAHSLSGSQVGIETVSGTLINGTLVGVEKEEQSNGGEKISREYLTIMEGAKLRRVAFDALAHLEFTEPGVQAEIEKALRRQSESIKPDSTFVALTLRADNATTAYVQYTIPAAAWKLSYRIRQNEKSITLDALAVVDNNTEQDWENVRLSVVTGDPISFSTDLATAETPRRKHINLIPDEALGGYEVEEEMTAEAVFFEAPEARDSGVRIRALRSLTQSPRVAQKRTTASMETAETTEVGDFALFRAISPVTIPSKQSSVVPLIRQELEDGREVLHFDPEKHPSRPFRSLQIKNETTHNLGRGVCTVYNEGIFSGNCIIPSLAVGQETLIPYALENGVTVQSKSGRTKTTQEEIKLSEGTCYECLQYSKKTVYTFKNNRDINFDCFLDHSFNLSEPKLSIQAQPTETQIDKRSLSQGARAIFHLPAQSTIKLTISESTLEREKISILDELNWLEKHVRDNGPLSQNPEIQSCLLKLEEIEAKRRQDASARKEIQRLEAKQKRLRDNLKSSKTGASAQEWQNSLAKAEDRISEIEETIVPSLEASIENLLQKLRKDIKQISLFWKVPSK